MKRVRELFLEKHPEFVRMYEEAWPVSDFISTRLQYTKKQHKLARPVAQHQLYQSNLMVRSSISVFPLLLTRRSLSPHSSLSLIRLRY